MSFEILRDALRAQFARMTAGTNRIYRTDIDRDVIWQTYLENFSEADRQQHNCNLCKSFLRQFGGIVSIDAAGTLSTLWDFLTDDPEYVNSVAALRRYVASREIVGPFYDPAKQWGTERNLDAKRSIWWTHFHVTPPSRFVVKEDAIGPRVSAETADHGVFLRALSEISEDAVATLIDLIGQNSLYRGQEHLHALQAFQVEQKAFKQVPAGLQSNWVWNRAASVLAAVSRIRNTAIGTLLVDLSEGKPLDAAVASFEHKTAPANYKRPTALVTPAMVEKAQKRIEELGFTAALARRTVTATELPVDQALFVYRPVLSAASVFEDMKKNTVVNPKSLTKVDTLTFADFVTNVLPGVARIELLVENRHSGNFVTLVGPVDKTAPSMFKWNNGYSWSYSGGVADSIKERVKRAGGRVDAFLRASLSWSNYDDLDLHMRTPRGEIMFSNKEVGGGRLDVDMNAGGGTTRDPVENIFFGRAQDLVDGTYTVFVHNWARREDTASGFTAELEVDGELYTKSVGDNGPSSRNHADLFTFHVKKGVVTVEGTSSGYSSQTKWGLASGVFHQVDVITLSPNHWSGAVGNKHAFFLLSGAKSDEKIRSFYNEFLNTELDAERKVLEVLGGRLTVDQQPGELSGLGFSETIPNEVFVRVHGRFTRTLKLVF